MPRPLGLPHPRFAQPVQPEGGQIEEIPVSLSLGEEAGMGGIEIQKGLGELRSHLIGALADRRPDDGPDARTGRAKVDHRVDRGVKHPVERPAPARVGRADDAPFRAGEKHRLAVGGQHGERDAGGSGHQRIGTGPLGKRFGHRHHIGGVDLVDPLQMRQRHPHGLRHPGAVDLHHLGLIGTAGATVQPREYTRRRTAPAREKSVAQRREQIGGEDFEGHGSNPGGGAAALG